MYKAVEVDVSSKTKPPNKKSFMVEDLLRTTNTTDVTDKSHSQQFNIEKHSERSTNLCSTKKDASSTKTSPNDYTSRESDYNQEDDSSSSNTAALSLHQQCHLEKVFSLQQYLGTKERQRLATTIRATDQQVKMWFQNKRMTQKLQIAKAQQRHTKLAYLDSLAQSLLKTPQQPRIRPRRIHMPAVSNCYSYYAQAPSNNYHYLPMYSRPQRVTPFTLCHNRYSSSLNSLPYVVKSSKYPA